MRHDSGLGISGWKEKIRRLGLDGSEQHEGFGGHAAGFSATQRDQRPDAVFAAWKRMCCEFISIERESGDLAVEMFRDIDIVVCVEGLDAGVNPKSGFGQGFVGEDLSDRVVPEPLCAGCCRFEGYAMIAGAIGGCGR